MTRRIVERVGNLVEVAPRLMTVLGEFLLPGGLFQGSVRSLMLRYQQSLPWSCKPM